jgi:hypothetical protein
MPSKAERVEYVQFWRQKLKTKPEVEFPETLVEPIAGITHDFSFAYIQEAFVSSLLDIAHHRNDEDEDEKFVAGAGGGDEDLDKYELWRVIKEQVKILRGEMDDKALTGDVDLTAPATHTATSTSHNYMESDELPSTSPNDINLLTLLGNSFLPSNRRVSSAATAIFKAGVFCVWVFEQSATRSSIVWRRATDKWMIKFFSLLFFSFLFFSKLHTHKYTLCSSRFSAKKKGREKTIPNIPCRYYFELFLFV